MIWTAPNLAAFFCHKNWLLFVAKNMGKHARSVDIRVAQRLRKRGPGWVLTPADLHDLGSRTAVATALKRRKAAGVVLRDLGFTHLETVGRFSSPLCHKNCYFL